MVTGVLVFFAAAASLVAAGRQLDPGEEAPPEAACRGRNLLDVDVDGDGRSDRAYHEWFGGDSAVGVCTAAGVVAELPGVGQTEVFQAVDIEPDGRDELLPGGTTVSAAGVQVAKFVDGRLGYVQLGGEDLGLWSGTSPEYPKDPAEGDQPLPVAVIHDFWGCEDHDGDGVREVVQVRLRSAETEYSWERRIIAVDGLRASVVDVERGERPRTEPFKPFSDDGEVQEVAVTLYEGC